MAINLDRGPADLEEVIDKQQKQIDWLKKQTKKTQDDRIAEIMALYAEVKRLKNENEDLRLNKIKSQYTIENLEKELHDRKAND
jgi:predicted RNase H-like nuclease (RuvC/YqgF family)|tara:strand:- start:23 stop:274 length:252 start_codon:yes stop_codon:yes gene_type:complete